jgi:hypothetical protein
MIIKVTLPLFPLYRIPSGSPTHKNYSGSKIAGCAVLKKSLSFSPYIIVLRNSKESGVSP